MFYTHGNNLSYSEMLYLFLLSNTALRSSNSPFYALKGCKVMENLHVQINSEA